MRPGLGRDSCQSLAVKVTVPLTVTNLNTPPPWPRRAPAAVEARPGLSPTRIHESDSESAGPGSFRLTRTRSLASDTEPE